MTMLNEKQERVLVGMGWTPPAPPAPRLDNTFQSISGHDIHDITITPIQNEDGELQWQLFIPPTTVDAFVSLEGAEVNPEVDEIKVGMGYEQWDTLIGAITSLTMAYRQGNVKFNDGRVVS